MKWKPVAVAVAAVIAALFVDQKMNISSQVSAQLARIV